MNTKSMKLSDYFEVQVPTNSPEFSTSIFHKLFTNKVFFTFNKKLSLLIKNSSSDKLQASKFRARASSKFKLLYTES